MNLLNCDNYNYCNCQFTPYTYVAIVNNFIVIIIYCWNSNFITVSYVPYRCLKADLVQQTICANFSVATDYYIYGYTSYANLTYFVMLLHMIETAANFDYNCTQFTAYYFCNIIFPPCDFTTGAPRAVCTESCHYARTQCDTTYTQVKTFFRPFGFVVSDNCENTFEPVKEIFGFPCSSSSLQNGCIDLLGM